MSAGGCGFDALTGAGTGAPEGPSAPPAGIRTMGEPAQLPFRQWSPCVQALWSSQVVPSGSVAVTHWSSKSSQLPVWHSLPPQVRPVWRTQWPDWHHAVFVQNLPSSQSDSSGRTLEEQVPVDGLQVPALWHWSKAVQTTGLLPVQMPAWQVSVCVQTLPSLHVVPSTTGGPASHSPVLGLQVLPVWHEREVHFAGVPVHTPA